MNAKYSPTAQLRAFKLLLRRPYTKTDRIATVVAVATVPIVIVIGNGNAERVIGLLGVVLVLMRAGSSIAFFLSAVSFLCAFLFFVVNQPQFALTTARDTFYLFFVALITNLLEDQPERVILAHKRENFKAFTPVAKPVKKKKPRRRRRVRVMG